MRQQLNIDSPVHGYLWREEQRADGAVLSASSFRDLKIEGELAVRLIDTTGAPADWVVDYMPVVELHHGVFDGKVDERAAELVARNAIHAGVVAASDSARCRLGAVPLDVPMKVTVDGNVRESPVLRDLQIGSLRGPLATTSWLVEQLQAEGRTELEPGQLLLTATPGSLIPVAAGSSVRVAFDKLSVSCTVV